MNIARAGAGFSLMLAGLMQLFSIDICGQRAQPNPESAEIDRTFAVKLGGGGRVERTIHQPDGKTIIIGGFTGAGGTERQNVVCLNADNSIDASFNLPPNVSSLNLELLPDGKFVASGSVTLFRLNPDGSIDSSFSFTHSIFFNRFKIKQRTDGKTLAVGDFEVKAGDTLVAEDLIVVDQSGVLVSGFRPEISGYIVDAVPMPEGKTAVYGRFEVKRAGQSVGRNFVMLDETAFPSRISTDSTARRAAARR